MGLESTIEHLSFLTKLGINLEELRVATRRILSRVPYIRGRGLDETGKIVRLREGTVGGPLSGFGGKVPSRILKKTKEDPELGEFFARGVPPRGIYGNPQEAVQMARQQAQGQVQMAQQLKEMGVPIPEGTVQSLPALRNPLDKETVNRAFLTHEGREVGPHPGIFQMATGHLSVKPPLTDLNLALSLPEERSGAQQFILEMRRPEIAGIQQSLGLERLPLGKERMSRHAIRRIQALLDRKTVQTGEELGIDMNQAAVRRPRQLQALRESMGL